MSFHGELESWLKPRQNRFVKALEKVERIWDAEVQKKRPVNGHFPYEPKTVFIGLGMCEIGTMALVLGLDVNFGKNVLAEGSHLQVPGFSYSHMVARATVTNESYALDATRRQIFPKDDAGVVIIPFTDISSRYNKGFEFKRYTMKGITQKVLRSVFNKTYAGITLDHLQMLVDTLKA